MATHSSILAWRIPMDRGAWGPTVHSVAQSQTRLKQLSTHTHTVAPFLVFFKEISTLFSTVVVSVYIPTNSARGFPFLHIL